VVYDDAGGFYDRLVPPHEGVPADGAACTLVDPAAPKGSNAATCGSSG
jgi:hypothetical protein